MTSQKAEFKSNDLTISLSYSDNSVPTLGQVIDEVKDQIHDRLMELVQQTKVSLFDSKQWNSTYISSNEFIEQTNQWIDQIKADFRADSPDKLDDEVSLGIALRERFLIEDPEIAIPYADAARRILDEHFEGFQEAFGRAVSELHGYDTNLAQDEMDVMLMEFLKDSIANNDRSSPLDLVGGQDEVDFPRP